MVDLKRYRKATSYSRSIQLLGYTVGSVLGQLLVSFDLMSYKNMLVFTLVLTSIALLTSCLLPMPQQSMFFHRRQTTEQNPTQGTKNDAAGTVDPTEHVRSLEEPTGKNVETMVEKDKVEGKELDESVPTSEDFAETVGVQSCGQVLLQLWRDFRHCYSTRQLIYWSVWWALATCGYNQTVNYVQVSCEANITHTSPNLRVWLP